MRGSITYQGTDKRNEYNNWYTPADGLLVAIKNDSRRSQGGVLNWPDAAFYQWSEVCGGEPPQIKAASSHDRIGRFNLLLGHRRQACKVSLRLHGRPWVTSSTHSPAPSPPRATTFGSSSSVPKMDLSRPTLRVMAGGTYKMLFPWLSAFPPFSSSVSKLERLLSFQPDPCLKPWTHHH